MINYLLQTCGRSFFTFRTYSNKMSRKALVFLAEGAEEMEAVISIDVLRRGGVDVVVAGVPNNAPIKCSRGVVINPNVSVQEAQEKGPYDVVVLPGGLGGAKVLGSNESVGKILKEQESAGRMIAAICAAPALSLKTQGIGKGKKVTCYPSFEKEITAEGDYEYINEKVVVDGNLTTSQGPFTAFDFALSLVSQLLGKDKAAEVAKGLLAKM